MLLNTLRLYTSTGSYCSLLDEYPTFGLVLRVWGSPCCPPQLSACEAFKHRLRWLKRAMPAEPEAYRHKRNLYKMIPQLSRSHRCINRWMKTHLRNLKGQRTWQRSPQLDLKLPVLIPKPVAHRAQKRVRRLVQTPLEQDRDHSLERCPARRPAQVATVRPIVAVGTVAADLERSWIWYKYSGVSLYRSTMTQQKSTGIESLHCNAGRITGGTRCLARAVQQCVALAWHQVFSNMDQALGERTARKLCEHGVLQPGSRQDNLYWCDARRSERAHSAMQHSHEALAEALRRSKMLTDTTIDH